MKQLILVMGSVYGALSVILGAFAAHALKKQLPEAALESFQTGVKYQMYHAIVLLIIGFYFSFTTRLEVFMGWAYIVGVLLFSFSIYLLSLSTMWKLNLKFLGPVTPLGGLLLIVGWVLLLVRFTKQ